MDNAEKRIKRNIIAACFDAIDNGVLTDKEYKEIFYWLRSRNECLHITTEEINALKVVLENRRALHNASVGGDPVYLGLESLWCELGKVPVEKTKEGSK